MTKTNKTLLCVLLATVLAFALALTALTITAQTATAEGETKLTLEFIASNRVAGASSVEYSANGIVFTNSNSNDYNEPARIYANSTTTITCANMVKIVFNCNSASYATALAKSKINDTISGSANQKVVTYTFDKAHDTVSFKVSNQVRLDSIEVYVAGASCDHSADKLTKTEAKAATCTEAGNVEYYTCTCGKIFADSAATTELTETAIPALGHTFGEWVFNNVAHTATRECSVCHTIETKDNTAITIFVNGEKLLPDGTDLTIRKATIEMGSEVLEISTLSENGQIYQGDEFYATFVTSRADKFDHANYTVTVEGGTLVWDEGSTDSATITVGETALEVNITVVYNCPHTTKTYTRIAGTETHKVVCSDCGATLVEEDACVATGENVATCMKEGKCDLCGGAIAKLEHGTEGCSHTAEEILVLKAYEMTAASRPASDAEDVTITGVVCSTYSSSNNKLVITVGSLGEEYKVTLFKPTNNDKLPLANLKIGDVITVTGKLFKYADNTIQFSAGSTYTNVVASKFEVSQSIAAGDGSKEVTDETSGAKTIYVKNGSQIVVTYAITANDGINTFIATLKYNKALFSIVSVTITDGFGAGTAVRSGNVGVTDYKVYIEGDGEGYTANYTGEFVTVVYQFNGDATATIAASEFGLMDVNCYTNHASGFVEADTTIGTSDETFDFIKQASITVEKTSFVYNGKAITAIGKGEHDQIKVTADGEGAISYKWYTDGTYATEVGEGYEVKNAGKYYLKLIVATTAAFEGSELKVEITITPFDLKNAESEIVITANDKQVTGSALTWTVAELTINGGNLATARGYDSDENIFTATIAEHSLTNVGETQNVAVTLALNANYTYGGENSVAATVTLKVVAYANAWTTEPQNITKDFDNNKLTFAYAAEHGTPVYYLGGEVKTAEELANAIVNAGTYEVKIVVEVVGYSNLEKTITITINKLKIDASSMVFDYSEDGKIKWSNPTKAIGSTGAIDLPTVVKFTYTLVDGKTENYGEDAVLEYLAQAEGAYTLNVIPGDAVNYEGTSTTTKTVYTITFAEGTHDGDNVIEGVAAYATVYRFDGQNAPAAPAAPVLAGYRFDGWTNSDMFGVAVTASVTLTAQWVKTYVIAWNNDNGSALESKTVDAGTQIAYSFETAPTSVLGADDYYTYTFAGWKDGEEVRELGYMFTVNGDITVTATYTSTLAYVDVTYTLTYGNNTTATDTITKVAIDTAVSAIEGLPELKAYTWFKNDGWKCGENAFIAATANLANEKVITISATYVFAIGNGDVDGSGTVDPSDIVLYRKHIVGGYDITPVTDAWATATAADFDESKVYFLAQVANVDEDGSDTNDVRDVSTIRMALVGAYGYTIKNGAVIKGGDATAQSAKVQYKQVLAPMGLFGKKFAL